MCPIPLRKARQPSRKKVYQGYRAGATTETLARRFRRLPNDITRMVQRMRAQQILETPLTYVPHEQFPWIYEDPSSEETALGPMPSDNCWQPAHAPSGVPAYLAPLYEIPRLTRSQESHLFRKMNYLKYKATMLRHKLDIHRPSPVLMDEIEECQAEATVIQNHLVRANLRLVISVVKQIVGLMVNVFGLVGDGNMVLIRAVEEFDFSRGDRFSTYAIEAMENAFARTIPAQHYRHRRFRASCEA